MRINNNLMSMNTYRQYSVNASNAATSTEKLSSGYRINRAGDDAAGLAISEKMRAQIRGLNMASKNSQDAISLVQTAEGALNETHSILQRMRELAVQASSDTNDGDTSNGTATVDRAALNEEFQALKKEINEIASKSSFNGKKLLNGSFGKTSTLGSTTGGFVAGTAGVTSVTASGFSAASENVAITAATGNYSMARIVNGKTETVTIAQSTLGTTTGGTLSFTFSDGANVTITGASHAADAWAGTATITATGNGAVIQTGADEGDVLQLSIGDMSATALGLGAELNSIDGSTPDDGQHIASRESASQAISLVNSAINQVSTQRSKLGAYQNRLQHKINNLDTSSENLTAAESRIRDLDMAKEMTNYTKNNILVQAATAMLAQANSAPQGVLQLLQ